MEQESRRGKRRRLTETIARRRRSDYVHLCMGGDPSGWAETSHNYWAKRGTCCCTCSKKHRGAPRRDKGLCCWGAHNRIYTMRAQARELARLVILRGEDPLGDAVALLATTRPVNDLW